MAQFYDEEGNLIEGALSPEEIEAIKQEKETIAKELAEKSERLAKLEAKDMNFRRLEQMTEEEKAKLSSMEKEILLRQEEVERKNQEFTTRQVEFYKSSAISVLAGDDNDLREKVLRNYDRIKDDATTPDEISKKMHEAYSMTVGTMNVANPLNVAMGFSGGQPPKKEDKSFADTDEGKSLAASLGLGISKINK